MATSKVAAILAAVMLVPAAAFSQGVGIGPRLSFVRGDAETPGSSAERFTGGALRLGGGRAAIELAMDYRSGLTGDLTERIKSYPIQASLLLFPVRAAFAPYVLAGIGWYSQRVMRLEAPDGEIVISDETTRRRGYHAGFGAEIRLHRHLGLHGDYRYTKLRFNDEDSSPDLPGWLPGVERLRMSHDGSMITTGLTLYF